MITHNQIKQIKSLELKKNREEHRMFVAEGVKVVKELVLSAKIRVKQVFALRSFLEDNAKFLEKDGMEVTEVSSKELERMSFLKTPQEVLALCDVPSSTLQPDILKKKLTLVLDDIKDPGNLGTIIRVADWFGITNVVCSQETVEVFNPKVIQSTMGSIARVSVHYTDLGVFFDEHRTSRKNTVDFPVYGAVLGGDNIYAKELAMEGLIVIGNESRGISEKVMSVLDYKISIPSFANGAGEKAESLNAAIATAIICAEFRRR